MGVGAAFAGGIQQFMQQYDRGQQIERQKSMDADNARRDQVREQRAGTEWQQGQDDRAHEIERRPIVEQRQDDQYGLQNSIRKLQLDQAQHTSNRQPAMDQQNDDSFKLQQRVRSQQISTGTMRQQLAKMGIAQKKIDQERHETEQALGRGFGEYKMTGDPIAIAHAWNETAAQSGLRPIKSLRKNEDGSFTLTMPGAGTAAIKDEKHLVAVIERAVNPKVFMQSYYLNAKAREGANVARAKNPKNFQALIRDNAGNLSKYDYAAGTTSPVTDQQGRGVSGTLAGRSRGDTPDQVAAKYYQALRKNAYSDEGAKQQTAEFMHTTHPNTRGWWNLQAQQRPAPQQQNTEPSHGRVVRTGKKDGVRFAQYEDGTIAPIQ